MSCEKIHVPDLIFAVLCLTIMVVSGFAGGTLVTNGHAATISELELKVFRTQQQYEDQININETEHRRQMGRLKVLVWTNQKWVDAMRAKFRAQMALDLIESGKKIENDNTTR